MKSEAQYCKNSSGNTWTGVAVTAIVSPGRITELFLKKDVVIGDRFRIEQRSTFVSHLFVL